MEALLARPNVQWVGAAPFERLPTYMRAIDVGIVPYADSAFNQELPLKTLEYLAAGRPTVARTFRRSGGWTRMPSRSPRGRTTLPPRWRALSGSPPTRRQSGRGSQSPPSTAGTCGLRSSHRSSVFTPVRRSRAGSCRVGSSFGPGMTQFSPTRMIRGHQTGRDITPVLLGLVVLIFAVPSMLVFQPLGAGATPAALMGTVLSCGGRADDFSATTTPGSASRHARSTGRWPSSQRHSCSATGPATSRPGPPWRPAQPIGRCCSSWHGPE